MDYFLEINFFSCIYIKIGGKISGNFFFNFSHFPKCLSLLFLFTQNIKCIIGQNRSFTPNTKRISRIVKTISSIVIVLPSKSRIIWTSSVLRDVSMCIVSSSFRMFSDNPSVSSVIPNSKNSTIRSVMGPPIDKSTGLKIKSKNSAIFGLGTAILVTF